MSRDIIDITEIGEKRIEIVSSILKYVGLSKIQNPLTSNNIWQISRVSTQDGQEITEYADVGRFTQIWDDRNTIFPVIPFINETSLSFDGINELLDGGDIHQYDINSSWSFGIWIKPTINGATQTIFSKVAQTNNWDGYALSFDGTGQIVLEFRTTTQTETHTFNSTLITDVWQHLTFTYDGSSNLNGAKVYLNGVLDITLPPSTPLTGTLLAGYPFQMGSLFNNIYYLGKLDNGAFWNIALTQTNINDLYNSGSPTNPLLLNFVNNLVSWYRFGDNDSSPTISDNHSDFDLTMINMDTSNFTLDVP